MTMMFAKEYWGEVRERALRDAAADVCVYCGRRSPGGVVSDIPNEANNYVHLVNKGTRLCTATAIWHRIHFERKIREAEARDSAVSS